MHADTFIGKHGGTVFVDSLMDRGWRLGPSSHLFTLPGCEDDLHEFAARLGLKRIWYQAHAKMPHYDLTAERRRNAIGRGAVELLKRRDVVDIIRCWRENAVRIAAAALLEQSGEPGGEIRDRRSPVDKNGRLSDEDVSAGFAAMRERLNAQGRPHVPQGRGA